MRNTIYIILFFCFACQSENANDCFKAAGRLVQNERLVPSFNRIIVNRGITLIITQADDYKVTVESGTHLINDVRVEVLGDRLVITDDNTCNYVRDYGITKVYVETPTLSEIRNASQYTVSSNGVLTYPNLRLVSEDFIEHQDFTVGDFNLTIQNTAIDVVANNLSSFYISGSTDALFVGFYSGSGRFEGENLIAQTVEINHRGSNDMIIHPIQELTGVIRSTGDVIAVNHPPVVAIDRLYNGALIFN